MKLLTDLNQLKEACEGGTAMTIGMFDGVHRGHKMLINKAVAHAKAHNLTSLVFTFSNHPLEQLAPPYAPHLLSSVQGKASLIEQQGPQLCLMLEFSPELASMSAQEFLDQILVEQCRARYIACGEDFRFGHRGAGDVELLAQHGRENGYLVEVCGGLIEGDSEIRSTRVRQALLGGNIQEATRLLGRPYRLAGEVVGGDGRGRTIGFPTANLHIDPRRQMPGDGVYAVRVTLGEQTWGGMMNIGPRPTFDAPHSVEVHLFDYSGDLYGAQVLVQIVARIRDTRRFASVQDLIDQLNADKETCQSLLGEH